MFSHFLRNHPADAIIAKNWITETDHKCFHFANREACRNDGHSGTPTHGKEDSINELPDRIDRFAFGIMDRDLERHLPGQRMGGAPEAGIVGPECHLDHVEQTFVSPCLP